MQERLGSLILLKSINKKRKRPSKINCSGETVKR